MKEYKRWLVRTFLLVLIFALLPFSIIAGFNYYVDPLWNFAHANEFNDYQDGFDERQLKTNTVTHTSFDYDTLIVGTSRTTYVNHSEFKGLNAFNYALSSMMIDEYNDYIEYAKKQNGKDFDTIVMELYFGGFDKERGTGQLDPEHYFQTSNEFLYPFKSLMSFDTFDRAKNNYEASKQNELKGPRSYDRNNEVSTTITNEKMPLMVNGFLEKNEKNLIKTGSYPYDPSYFDMLKELKQNNPNTKFLIYIDPTMAPRIDQLLENPIYWDMYKKWIYEIVDIFGSTYNFMTVNSVTKDLTNYFDTHHFYPQVGNYIAHRLTGDTDVPDDFGVLVTKDNIDEHFKEVEQQIKDYTYKGNFHR